MAYWYDCNAGAHQDPEYNGHFVGLGMDWGASYNPSYVTTNVTVYRWDKWKTENTGGKFWEYMDEPGGSRGSWGPIGFGISTYNGQSRVIDSFGTRTYYKRHEAYTINFELEWSNVGYVDNSYNYHKNASNDYANWYLTIPALDSYTIHFNLNGGSGNFPDLTKWYDERLYFPATAPTKEGFNFKHWKSQQGDITYQPGDWTNWDISQTLVAVWEPKKYQVVFNANNGVFDDGSKSKSITFQHGDIISLPKVERQNYKFLGWTRNKDGSGGYIQPNMKVYGKDSFYAQWELAANGFVKVNGVYKPAKMYVKQSETYCAGVVAVKNQNVYKNTTL